MVTPSRQSKALLLRDRRSLCSPYVSCEILPNNLLSELALVVWIDMPSTLISYTDPPPATPNTYMAVPVHSSSTEAVGMVVLKKPNPRPRARGSHRAGSLRVYD